MVEIKVLNVKSLSIKKLIFNLLLLTSILFSCAKDEVVKQTESLVFPIGRSSYQSNSYSVTVVNDSVYSYTPNVIIDSNDGYWLEFSRSDLEKFQSVHIQFNREVYDLNLFHEQSYDFSRWLAPSFYIDSDNEQIKAKAIELTQGLTSNLDKAKIIQWFVISNVYYTSVSHSFYNKASTTINLKEGTCMNFSRLFVALCRAANVPSRTIWGVIYGGETVKNYGFHHQWAEFLDDNNNWRVLDFTFQKTYDINDIRYLDIIYAPEENDRVRDRYLKEIMISSLSYYNNYPVASKGMGFHSVSENYPVSLTVGYVYKPTYFHE